MDGRACGTASLTGSRQSVAPQKRRTVLRDRRKHPRNLANAQAVPSHQLPKRSDYRLKMFENLNARTHVRDFEQIPHVLPWVCFRTDAVSMASSLFAPRRRVLAVGADRMEATDSEFPA